MRTAILLVLVAACGAPPEPVRAPAALDSGAAATPDAADAPRAACRGKDLELEKVLYAPACAAAQDQVSSLEAAPSVAPKIEASKLTDGRVLIRVTNPTATPMPLVFSAHSAVDTFPVRARPARAREVTGRVSLVPAEATFPSRDDDLGQGWHYARVVLEPGGSLSVRLTLDLHIEDEDHAGCPPNAKCAPTKTIRGPLPQGTYVLHVDLPLETPRLDDRGADVPWTVP